MTMQRRLVPILAATAPRSEPTLEDLRMSAGAELERATAPEKKG
ncbi:hypothetical protein [Glycomyces sp. L485]|nr:hypothetical protein [Glycomyces sp. L485]